MWLSINELAKERAVTPESIRKKIRPLKDTDLKGHWKKEGANTYLDDYAVDYINEHSYHKDLYERTATAEDKTNEYKNDNLNLQDNFNALSIKHLELQNTLTNLYQELHNKESECNKLKEESLVKDYEIKILNYEKDAVEKEKDRLNADIDNQKIQYNELKASYEHTNNENKAKTDEISRLNDELEQLKAELDKERNKGIFARLFKK